MNRPQPSQPDVQHARGGLITTQPSTSARPQANSSPSVPVNLQAPLIQVARADNINGAAPPNQGPQQATLGTSYLQVPAIHDRGSVPPLNTRDLSPTPTMVSQSPSGLSSTSTLVESESEYVLNPLTAHFLDAWTDAAIHSRDTSPSPVATSVWVVTEGRRLALDDNESSGESSSSRRPVLP